MVEFKVKIDDSIVQTFGYKEVESYLQDVVQKLILKAAAQDVMEDMKPTDHQNDKEWQTARHLAWQQEKHKYLISK